MIFFTGCTHFGHTNILKYDKRPYSSIEEHDEQLIKNINSLIKKQDDEIYFLGDFTFLSDIDKIINLFYQIKGIKHLIYGNHDQVIRRNRSIQNLFESISEYKEIEYKNQKIILFHYPLVSWNKMHKGSWLLHSHIHGNKDKYYPEEYKILDIGTMNNNYLPYTFEQIKTIMQSKRIVTFD